MRSLFLFVAVGVDSKIHVCVLQEILVLPIVIPWRSQVRGVLESSWAGGVEGSCFVVRLSPLCALECTPSLTGLCIVFLEDGTSIMPVTMCCGGVMGILGPIMGCRWFALQGVWWFRTSHRGSQGSALHSSQLHGAKPCTTLSITAIHSRSPGETGAVRGSVPGGCMASLSQSPSLQPQ